MPRKKGFPRILSMLGTLSTLATGLALVVGLALAGRAAADPPSGEPTVGTIVDAQAVFGDLAVTLDWSESATLPSTATLVLETNGGVEVMRTTVTPAAGSQAVTFTGALAGFQSDGWFYHLRLEDAGGAVLGALPFDVVLSCQDAQHCTLVTRPGFAAPPFSQLVSGELLDALDGAAASPSGDLLTDVKAQHFDLIGEVYAFADRYRTPWSNPLPGPDDPPQIGACLCSWISSVFYRPVRGTSIKVDQGPTTQRGNRGPGAINKLEGKYDGNLTQAFRTTNYEVQGETEIRLQLRCYRVTGWRVFQVLIDGVWHTVWEPILGEPCPGCAGTVDHYGEYYASLYTETDKSTFGADNALAKAKETGLYKVNGAIQFNRVDEISQAGNGNNGLEIVDSASGQVPQPAVALFRSVGRSYAQGINDDDALGRAANSYSIGLYSWAQCAQPRDHTVWAYGSYENRIQDLRDNLKIFFGQFGKVVNP